MPFFDFEKEKRERAPKIKPLKKKLNLAPFDKVYALIASYFTYQYFLKDKPLTAQNLYDALGKKFILTNDDEIYFVFKLLYDLTQKYIYSLDNEFIDDIILGTKDESCTDAFIINKQLKNLVNQFGVVRDEDFNKNKLLCVIWGISIESQMKLLHFVHTNYKTDNIMLLKDKLLDQFIASLDSIIDYVSPQYVEQLNNIVSIDYIGSLPDKLKEINLYEIILDYIHTKPQLNVSAICFLLAIHSFLLIDSPDKKDVDFVLNDLLLSVNKWSENYKFTTSQKVVLKGLFDLYIDSPKAFEYYKLALQLGLPKLVRIRTKQRFLYTIEAIRSKGITYLLKKKQLKQDYLRQLKDALHDEGIVWLDRYLNMHKPVPIPANYIQKAFRRLPNIIKKYNLKITLNDLLFNKNPYSSNLNKNSRPFLLAPFLFAMDDKWYMRKVLAFEPYIKQKFSPETLEYVFKAMGVGLVVSESDSQNEFLEKKYNDIISAVNSLVNMAVFFEHYSRKLQFVAFENYINRIKYRKEHRSEYIYDDFVRDIVDYVKQHAEELTPRMLTSSNKYVKSFFRDNLSDPNQLLPGDKYFDIYYTWRNGIKRKTTRLVFFKRPIPKDIYEECPSIQKMIESPSDTIFKLVIMTPACYNKFEALPEKERKYFVLLQEIKNK